MSNTTRPLIFSLYFSYVSHSGGVIDFAENLLSRLAPRYPAALRVLRPSPSIKAGKVRTLLRFLADMAVAFRYWGSKVSVLYPNYFFLPLPFARSRSIVVVHDLMFKHYPVYVGAAKRLVLDCSYRMVRRWADGVVFISKDSQDDFLRRYGAPRKYTYIYNPIVLDRSTVALQSPGSGADYAIANFHYYPHKNIEGLFRIFSRLSREWPGLKLVFTGNKSPLFDEVVKRFALEERIEHRGFLPKQEVIDLISNARFFLSMSQFEGFNMSAAEAALLGKPLILSDIPVHRELFSDCAYFLNDRASDQALEGALAFLQGHVSGRPEMAAMVDPDTVAQRYLEFIEEVENAR